MEPLFESQLQSLSPFSVINYLIIHRYSTVFDSYLSLQILNHSKAQDLEEVKPLMGSQ